MVVYDMRNVGLAPFPTLYIMYKPFTPFRCHHWGKARPWVLWSAVPMGLGLVLLFNVPASLGSSGKQHHEPGGSIWLEWDGHCLWSHCSSSAAHYLLLYKGAGTLTLCFILPKMIGNLLYPPITKIMGKWKSLVLGYVLEMAGVAIMALTPAALGTAAAGLVLLGIGGIPHTAGLFAVGLIIIMFTNIDKIYPRISSDLAERGSEAGQ